MRRLTLFILVGMVIAAMLTATTSRYIVRQSFTLHLELDSPSASPTLDPSGAPTEVLLEATDSLAVASDPADSTSVLPAVSPSGAPAAASTPTEASSPTPSPTITTTATATATATATVAIAEETATAVPTISAESIPPAQASASPTESMPTPGIPDATANGEPRS